MRGTVGQRAGPQHLSRRGGGGVANGAGARHGHVLWGWHLSQWVVFVTGMVLVVILVGWVVQRQGGVHWMRTEVTFRAAGSIAEWQQDLPADASLVPFAAAVQRSVTGGPQHRFSSDEATLDAFATHGVSVRLSDDGGQWVHAFNRPMLIVETVDPDPVRAQAMMREELAQIRRAATDLQAEMGVSPDQRFAVSESAADQEYAAPSRGQLFRAGVVVLGVGGLLSLLAGAAAGNVRAGVIRRGGVKVAHAG